MPSDPTISILIPVHNGERYIAQAIESALGQAETSLELIVVDDASTDRTAEIVEAYGPRLTYFRLEKQPSSIAAMNFGLKIARGRYVSVLHHDDYYLPGKLQRQLDLMEADPAIGLSYSAQWFVGPVGEPLVLLRSPLRHTDYVVDGVDELHHLAVQNYLNFCNVIVRRSALEAVAPFDDRLYLSAEWAPWFQIALRHRIAYVDQPLVCYRIHPNAQTFSRSEEPDEWRRQAVAVTDFMYSDPMIPPSVASRRGLTEASISLSVFLLSLFRRRWGLAVQSLRRVVAAAGPQGLPSLINSSVIVPRLIARSRLLLSLDLRHKSGILLQPHAGSVAALRCPRCSSFSGYALRCSRRGGRRSIWSTRMRCLACGAKWQTNRAGALARDQAIEPGL
jgi:glycosyltransferase involved in cell wall biosynthesis